MGSEACGRMQQRKWGRMQLEQGLSGSSRNHVQIAEAGVSLAYTVILPAG